MMKCHHCDELY